jgi:hypothetical protein
VGSSSNIFIEDIALGCKQGAPLQLPEGVDGHCHFKTTFNVRPAWSASASHASFLKMLLLAILGKFVYSLIKQKANLTFMATRRNHIQFLLHSKVS